MLRPVASVAACVLTFVLVAGCMDRLPDQDLRILSASPAARLSADILWSEYESDADAADDAYWGEAIIVTGTVTGIRVTGAGAEDETEEDPAASEPPRHVVVFGQGEGDDAEAVEATLLADQAAAIVENLATGQRLTIKCFCEGRQADAGGVVVLKSCVAP
jgi:hypothetical protein